MGSKAVGQAVLLLAVALPLCWGQEEPAGAFLETQVRAQRLRQALESGATVRIVAFGDSVTAGWATDGRNVYHRMVADALRYWYPQSDIALITHGYPGETTADALRRFGGAVVGEGPNLLLIQFGGNDMGWGRGVRAFRRDFASLLARAVSDTSALTVACLPPIMDADPANVWSETAREVTAQYGLPAADLDRAIREGDPDMRGPFPYTSHPGGFTHLVMAREVLRALREAMGVPATVSCRLATGSRLHAQPTFEVEAEISTLAGAATDCEFRFEYEGAVIEGTTPLVPDQPARISRPLRVARERGAQHAWGFPVRLFARGEAGFGGVDVCWLVTAPAVAADLAADGAEPADLTWHELTADSFTLGRHTWWGPGDLSARFAVVALADRLRFIVEVTDDDLSVATLVDPSLGDSVELYLDLRPEADQGRPVYSEGVLALQVIPPAGADGQTLWRSMDPLPDDLQGLSIECARTATGYTARLALPLAAVEARRVGQWPGLGFDVGVNDADFGGTRTGQMMWAGTGENYLNPAYLAGLYADPLPTGAVRQTLR